MQVTGGSARRALPGRGLWAAGSFGVRAITNAAALELRPRGIQVALLIVDAGIQPLDGSTRGGVSPEALADPRRIADARPLPGQPGRALRDTRTPGHPARGELDPLNHQNQAMTTRLEQISAVESMDQGWRFTVR